MPTASLSLPAKATLLQPAASLAAITSPVTRPRLVSFLRGSALALFLTSASARAQSVDVVIYGATPGGIAAAIAAAKGGRSVLLAEPTIRIGSMTTNGLSHPDFRAFEALTGAYLDLVRRTLAYYDKTYSKDSSQVKDSFRGTHAEPKVNLLLFQQMLAEHSGITVRTQWTLVDAYTRGPAGDRRVHSARFRDAAGREHRYEGKIFIDGSYEGDLIAAAQAPYRIGVESRDEYGESAAPEESSGDLQGYNFRLTMTQDPANRMRPTEPKGYRREDFTLLLDLIAAGKIKRAFGGYTDRDNVVKAQMPVLPNGKSDINDVTNGFVSATRPCAPRRALRVADFAGPFRARRRSRAALVRHSGGRSRRYPQGFRCPGAERNHVSVRASGRGEDKPSQRQVHAPRCPRAPDRQHRPRHRRRPQDRRPHDHAPSDHGRPPQQTQFRSSSSFRKISASRET